MDLIVVCSYAGMMSSEELKYRRWELIEVGTRDANRWLPQAITPFLTALEVFSGTLFSHFCLKVGRSNKC
jgi:hypothetical protein